MAGEPILVTKAAETYLTGELASAAGAHPNTVRLYEQWGFLPPAERGANGYRRWTAEHRAQFVFARIALFGLWPGRRIRLSALALVRCAAAQGPGAALPMAAEHLALVRAERARAEAAAAFLERWATGLDGDPGQGVRLTPREAAAAVDASPGQIRNWERNNIVETPRDPLTGYRFYTSREIGRLRVVRTLLLAGYSMTAILRMTVALDGGRRADLRGALDTLRPGEEALTAFDRWLSSLAEQEARAATLVRLLQERTRGAGGKGISSIHA